MLMLVPTHLNLLLYFYILFHFLTGSFQRWVLSQPGKAAISELTLQMAGMEVGEPLLTAEESPATKSTTSSVNHEALVQATLNAIASMKNPFDDIDGLMNIANRNIASKEAQSDIDSAYTKGLEQYRTYVSQRLASDNKDVFDTIPQLKLRGFTTKKPTSTEKQRDATRSIVEDRKLYSRLLVVSQARDPNLKEIMTYSLTKYPLSIATSEGNMQKILNKASLMHELEKVTAAEQLNTEDVNSCVLILDAMAVIRAHFEKRPPPTFAELGDAVFQFIIKQAKQYRAARVDWVIDQYRKSSIKNAERTRRGTDSGQRIAITDRHQKLPKSWSNFLKNSDNKSDLLEFLYNYMSTKETEPQLQIVITSANHAKRLSLGGQELMPELHCNHEEADTRMLFHAAQASQDGYDKVVICSPDTDVLVISLAAIGNGHIPPETCVGFLTGTSKGRRLLNISKMAATLGGQLCSSLPLLHALTGCDAVSCFHNKGKKRPLSLLKSSNRYMEGFSKISRNLSPADFTLLENFVCEIYGSKEEDINLTRFELYKKGALPSLMPPNKDCLELHCMRSAYQASVWTDLGNQLDMDAAIGFGWEIVDGQLEILWRRKEEAPADILKVGVVTVYYILP